MKTKEASPTSVSTVEAGSHVTPTLVIERVPTITTRPVGEAFIATKNASRITEPVMEVDEEEKAAAVLEIDLEREKRAR